MHTWNQAIAALESIIPQSVVYGVGDATTIVITLETCRDFQLLTHRLGARETCRVEHAEVIYRGETDTHVLLHRHTYDDPCPAVTPIPQQDSLLDVA